MKAAKTALLLLMLTGIGAIAQTPATSGEVRDAEINQLKQQLMMLMERVNALERQNKVLAASVADTAQTARQAAAVSATNAVTLASVPAGTNAVSQSDIKDKFVSKAAAWAEKIKFNGDIRFRYDYVDGFSGKDADSRMRIRARFGLEALVTDRWTAGIQLTSNPDDPISGNVSLGDNNKGKAIGFSRMYIKHQVFEDENLNVIAGKMGQPWLAVNDLAFDNDLNPEGAAATYSKKFGKGFELFANTGIFQIRNSLNDSQKSYNMLAGQIAGKAKMDDHYWLFGVSDYAYDNNLSNADVGTAKGMTTTKDISTIEFFTEAGSKVYGVPVALNGQYLYNPLADEENTGYLVGTKIGKADLGKLQFSYDYRNLEQNAANLMFTDSDCWSGGMSGRGHRFRLAYGWYKHVTPTLTYYLMERNLDAPADYGRLQADLSVKF